MRLWGKPLGIRGRMNRRASPILGKLKSCFLKASAHVCFLVSWESGRFDEFNLPRLDIINLTIQLCSSPPDYSRKV